MTRYDRPTALDVRRTEATVTDLANDIVHIKALGVQAATRFLFELDAEKANALAGLPPERDTEWSTVEALLIASLRKCLTVLERR